MSDLRADYRAWVKSHPNPTLGDGLTDALGAVGYAVESLPKPGHKMTQAAEQRLNEAMALLDAALATPAPTEDGPTVHVNDGSAHDNAMAWSAGHTDGWNEAQDALREMLVAIPATGLLEGANRYDTDDKYVLHVWRDGQSWDIEVPKVVGPAPTEDATPTICKCGAAKSYHGPGISGGRITDHEWEPRYPAPTEDATRALTAPTEDLGAPSPITGPVLARAWALSGRSAPLMEPDEWGGFALAVRAVLGSAAPTEDATVPNLNAQGVDMTQPMKVTSRDHPHTGEERDTLVDMVHDALASTFGCDHPTYHPSECEVVADALIYGPRATMNHHAPPPVMAEPHGE